MSATRPFRARELTPHGAGGVAVIALDGVGALERLLAIAPRAVLVSGEPRVVRLSHAGEDLDEAIVLVEGDTHIELHVHASPALVSRLLAILGARSDESVESRALEARARARLAGAASEDGARILLDQAEGALRRELARVLAGARESALASLAELAERGRIARHAIEPTSVVIAGPVNAGKSTLFNALCGRERAIVSASAGTTRDTLVERVRFGAYAVDLADTAGEREVELAPEDAAGEIERAGQALARARREIAALVLWLEPAGAPPAPPPPMRSRVASIVSRSDSLAGLGLDSRAPRISALNEPHAAARTVHEIFHRTLRLPYEPWRSGCAAPFDERSALAIASAIRLASEARADDWREPLERALAES